MTLDEFTEHARRAFESIPVRFRERVDGPVVVRDAHEHEHVPGSYVLGECHHHPDWTGESPLHSTVVLYHGSFLAIARRDPEFDIAHEIVETVLHEVQHHVEDAAGAARLRDLDDAEEQNDLRVAGHPHAPGFWRAGIDLGDGLYRVGPDLFLEVVLGRRAWERAQAEGLILDVLGIEVAAPEDALDAPPNEDAPPDEVELLIDWDWGLVPRDADVGSAGHQHGPPAGWGDLVVLVRRRNLVLGRGMGRVVS